MLLYCISYIHSRLTSDQTVRSYAKTFRADRLPPFSFALTTIVIQSGWGTRLVQWVVVGCCKREKESIKRASLYVYIHIYIWCVCMFVCVLCVHARESQCRKWSERRRGEGGRETEKGGVGEGVDRKWLIHSTRVKFLIISSSVSFLIDHTHNCSSSLYVCILVYVYLHTPTEDRNQTSLEFFDILWIEYVHRILSWLPLKSVS